MNTNITKWAFILSIIIVANLFFNYSISLVLNNPDHEVYCPFEKTSAVIQDESSCIAADGIWQPTPKRDISTINEPTGYCDLYSKCNKAYEDAAKVYEQKAFVALVTIGLLVLIGSVFVKANPVLNSALALTAVLNFIIASMRYWRYSDEILKVSILFVALATLIYFVAKKFNSNTQ